MFTDDFGAGALLSRDGGNMSEFGNGVDTATLPCPGRINPLENGSVWPVAWIAEWSVSCRGKDTTPKAGRISARLLVAHIKIKLRNLMDFM